MVLVLILQGLTQSQGGRNITAGEANHISIPTLSHAAQRSQVEICWSTYTDGEATCLQLTTLWPQDLIAALTLREAVQPREDMPSYTQLGEP